MVVQKKRLWWGLGLLVVMLAAAGAIWLAQPPSRPPVSIKASAPLGSALGPGSEDAALLESQHKCPDYAIDYKDFKLTISVLRLYYQRGNYRLLDLALNCLHDRPTRFLNGRTGGSAVYAFFRAQLDVPRAEVAAEAERIRQWREQVPQSRFAELAGLYLGWVRAWNARGGGYANTVTEAGWAEFYRELAATEQGLDAASPALKWSPLWSLQMLATVRDLPSGATRTEPLTTEALRRWPYYYEFYSMTLQRQLPQWGGSWDEIDTSIRRWSAQREAEEGRSLYARLYGSVIGKCVHPLETRIDWTVMRPSLVDLIERYPDPAHYSLAYSLATVYGDEAFARWVKPRVDPDADPYASLCKAAQERMAAKAAGSVTHR